MDTTAKEVIKRLEVLTESFTIGDDGRDCVNEAIELLGAYQELADQSVELNMLNFDDVDVKRLNDTWIAFCQLADQAPPEETAEVFPGTTDALNALSIKGE